MSTFLNNFS